MSNMPRQQSPRLDASTQGADESHGQSLSPDGSRAPRKKKRHSKRSFLFHPQEFGIAGCSGSGKTTLFEKLFAEFNRRYPSRKASFVKHDAHRFQMDHEGKDTQRMSQAGAHSVFINDKKLASI